MKEGSLICATIACMKQLEYDQRYSTVRLSLLIFFAYQFSWQFLIACSFFWLVNIALRKILIKNRNENDKNTNKTYDEKQKIKNKKKCQNSIWKNSDFFRTRPTNLWYNMLQTLEIRRKYNWSEIVSGTHSLGQLLTTFIYGQLILHG